MAYDLALAARVRSVFSDEEVVERPMFGGLCFMVDGAMCCGVTSEGLYVKLSPEAAAQALQEAHTSPFTMGARTSKGMVQVDRAGLSTDAALRAWVTRPLKPTR